MKKTKGAGMAMAIMLISVCGWVAIVQFVLAPNFWAGVALSFGGGIFIGVAVLCLMWRWWFKGIESRGR